MKETGGINHYLLQISIKKINDTLAAVGSPIETNDYIEEIFDDYLMNMMVLSLLLC